MIASNASVASATMPGCATQVPSWPSVASRSLSARTLANASSLACRIVLDRDLRRHAAHRKRPAPVAGLDAQQRVRTHEMRRHRDLRAVGQQEVGVLGEFLDARENVVPAPAVQPGGVFPQFVENLVHLERGEDRLDEHRRLDRALRDAELVLREHESVVPQPRFQVRLHLRQVEIRPRARARAVPWRCGKNTARNRTTRR